VGTPQLFRRKKHVAFNYDLTTQQDLAYYIHLLKGSNFILQGRLGLLKEKAKNTIAFLQKEYHLQ
jgi:hypothetical protein